jgi:hypothetical protein
MYVYNYRIFDRYNKPVASLAVLADDDPNWRPSEFRNSLFGCEAGIRFPIAKLLDLASEEAKLEADANPFAKIVLAHLKTQQTRNRPADRKTWKIRLIRGLYEQGYTPADVRELFRMIDWLMDLPKLMEDSFLEDVAKIEDVKRMPFITTPERVWLRKGMRLGIQSLLKARFGSDGLGLMPEIEAIYQEDRLEGILNAVATAKYLAEIRRLISAGDSPKPIDG